MFCTYITLFNQGAQMTYKHSSIYKASLFFCQVSEHHLSWTHFTNGKSITSQGYTASQWKSWKKNQEVPSLRHLLELQHNVLRKRMLREALPPGGENIQTSVPFPALPPAC